MSKKSQSDVIKDGLKKSGSKGSRWAIEEEEIVLECLNKNEDMEVMQQLLQEYDKVKRPTQSTNGRKRKLSNIKKNIDRLVSRGKLNDVIDNTVALRRALHGKEWWPYIKKQFPPAELRFFEAQWVIYQQQFGEDVLATEELQVKQLINVDILVTKNMIRRNKCDQEVERLQECVADQYKKPKQNRDVDYLANLENHISSLDMSAASYTNEFVKLSDKQDKLLDKLKASRDARIKRIEDSKTSWSGMLRELELESTRKRHGDDMEIMKLAKDNQIIRLSEWHRYEDGKLDQPFLTPETVKDEDTDYEDDFEDEPEEDLEEDPNEDLNEQSDVDSDASDDDTLESV